MKKSDLTRLIKEEAQKVIPETFFNSVVLEQIHEYISMLDKLCKDAINDNIIDNVKAQKLRQQYTSEILKRLKKL